MRSALHRVLACIYVPQAPGRADQAEATLPCVPRLVELQRHIRDVDGVDFDQESILSASFLCNTTATAYVGTQVA